MTARMPCGVTADLRQYEAKQSRDAELWDAYAPGIAQDKTDDILENKQVWGMTISDFLNSHTDAMDRLICQWKSNNILDAHFTLRRTLEEEIKAWLMENKQDEIWEVINSVEEE